MIIFRGGKYSIESAQKTLQYYVYEHAILFDKKNRCHIEVSSGDQTEVALPSNEDYSGFTVLHNHPDGTFISGNDMVLAFKYRFKELQVIGSLDHIYSLLTSGPFIDSTIYPNVAECYKEYWEARCNIDNFDKLPAQRQHEILLPYIKTSRYIRLLK